MPSRVALALHPLRPQQFSGPVFVTLAGSAVVAYRDPAPEPCTDGDVSPDGALPGSIDSGVLGDFVQHR